MIIGENQNTVVTVGDIQKNQVSIDPKNIEHIITILSSNLYSNPEESFLRETISNAWDAQVEANNTKDPIILSFKEGNNYLEDTTIAIRDFGTGISPERFKEVYLNIGSSTKRQSNEFIGGFGIGKFSALAVSDTVHITSFYEGNEYYYLMVKNGSKINIDLINTTPTDQPNGVEVKIQVSRIKGESIYRSISVLSYIPNLYINKEKDYTVKAFNERIITKYKNFNICSIVSGKMHILIGNILYRINKYKFPILSREVETILEDVAIKFEIGELTVTPNREDILYTDETIAKINEKIKAVMEEIEEIFKQQNNKDFSNIIEYWLYLNSAKKIILGDFTIDAEYSWLRDLTYATYKGKDLATESPDLVNNMYKFFKSNLKEFNCIASILSYRNGNNFSTKNLMERVTFLEAITSTRIYKHTNTSINTSIFILPSSKNTKSQYFKDYILENYVDNSKNNSILFFEKIDFRDKSFINKFLIGNLSVSKNKKECIWFCKEVIRALKPYTTVIDIVNSPDFIQYKKDNKPTIETLKPKSEIPFYINYKSNIGDSYPVSYRVFSSKTAQDINEKLKYCKSDSFIVLYGIKDNPYSKIFSKFKMWDSKKGINYVIVEVAKTNWKYMVNLPVNWVPIEKVVTYHCKEIISYATFLDNELHSIYRLNYNNPKLLRDVYTLSGFLPKQERKLIKYAYSVNYPYIESYSNINEIIDKWVTTIKSEGIEDTDLRNGLLLIKKYSEIIKIMEPILKITGEISYLFAYFGLKNKLFRLDNTVYQYLRDKLKLKIK